MLVRTFSLLPLAVLFTIPLCAHAADTSPSAEVAIFRALVIGKCHTPLTDDDRAYGETLRASLQVEMDRVWAELHAANPSETVNRAYDIFREWFDKVKAAAETKVQTLSCADLELQTKPVGR